MQGQQPQQQPPKKRRMTETEQRAHQVAGFVEAKIADSEGRVVSRLDEIKAAISKHIDGAEQRILQQVRKPERLTDRFLDWWRLKPASWLGWPILLFLFAVVFSVGRATG